MHKIPISIMDKSARPRQLWWTFNSPYQYGDVILGTIAFQITSLTIVYSIVYLSADQRKHQSSALLAFVRGIHRRPVNSPHEGPVTRKMFPFDDVIMQMSISHLFEQRYQSICNLYMLAKCQRHWHALRICFSLCHHLSTISLQKLSVLICRQRHSN